MKPTVRLVLCAYFICAAAALKPKDNAVLQRFSEVEAGTSPTTVQQVEKAMVVSCHDQKTCPECTMSISSSSARGKYTCVWNGTECMSSKSSRSVGHGYIHTMAQCAGEYYVGAIGLENEFGVAIYTGTVNAKGYLSATGEPGVGDVIGSTAKKVGPGDKISLMEMQVDLGAGMEMVSGPISMKQADVLAYKKAEKHLTATLKRWLEDPACGDGQGTKPSDGGRLPHGYDKEIKKGSDRVVPVKLILDKYNEGLAAKGISADFKLEMPAVWKSFGPMRVEVGFSMKCGKIGTAPNPQVNYGLKIQNIPTELEKLFREPTQVRRKGGMVDTWAEGVAMFKNIKAELPAYLAAQEGLNAQKDDKELQAIMIAFIWQVGILAYADKYPEKIGRNNGFIVKNVADQMFKASTNDMLRSVNNNAKTAIKAWYNAVKNAHPEDAIAAAFCGSDDCEGKMMKGAWGALRHKGSKTQGLRPAFKAKIIEYFEGVFGKDPTDRYGASETEAKYGDSAPDTKPPASHLAIKYDACFSVFEIHGKKAIVVEGRLQYGSKFVGKFTPQSSDEDSKKALSLLTDANK